MRYWFVNQGTSYAQERNGNYLYAPKDSMKHHTNVKDVKAGDIIFCNKKGFILCVAKALSDGYESQIPDSIKGLWGSFGYKVDVRYIDLKNKFRFNELKDIYLNNIIPELNPFDVNGNAKVGYLFPLEKNIASLFIDRIKDKKILSFIDEDSNLFFEEIQEFQEEKEQFEEISSGLIKGYSKVELEIKDKEKYQYVPRIDNGKNRVLREKTDAKLKATRMELANHNCEINHNHKTFTNSSGKYQYLECHHIIPLNAQKDFPNIKLDSMFNIIAVCPICHMQVHHATTTEKGEIFSKMYNIRKEEMLEHGFDLASINKIFNKYYLNKKED
jgi:hypothetical protein